MKRKSSLDRIVFDTETYELLSHSCADDDAQRDYQDEIGFGPSPMPGLQEMVGNTQPPACAPPIDAINAAWSREPMQGSKTDRNRDWLH